MLTFSPAVFNKRDLFKGTDRGENLIKELARHSVFGHPTQIKMLGDIPCFINEFWTSKQRQAHSIHEISYRACFKPQLPAFFIKNLTCPGDYVYDPFMGRGTTPIESALQGRIPFGNDANPLSLALTEPRINPPSLSDIQSQLQKIPWESFKKYKHEDLLVFYHPRTLAQIEGLRDWLIEREYAGHLSKVDRWIRMVALNRLTGHSSGFFSVYTMPPNQAVSVESQRKINERRQQTPPYRDVPSIIAKKSKSLLADGPVHAEKAVLLTKQSYETTEIPDNSIYLTVTSPPFLDIVNYEADNWLRCWFLGINPKKVKITTHRSVVEWEKFIRATLAELARITRPGGYVAFEVGEVRKGKVELENNVISAAIGLPLKPMAVIINRQKFTKTANCWGVLNNKAGTNSNRIVLMRMELH